MAGNKGKTAVWVILGFAVLGFGGFGVTSFSGGATKLATVGSKTITALDYQRDLNQQMRAFEQQSGQPVPFSLAQSFGLDQQVLQTLVNQRSQDNENTLLGLSVGDERVRDQIVALPAFAGVTGAFDRTAYADVIRAQGYTESSFEAAVRDDSARSILQTAIIGGVPVAKTYTDALVTYLSERRTVTWAPVFVADLESAEPDLSETDLATYYAANPAAFTTPEIREISYVWLTPEMLKDAVEIDEAAIRDLYDQRISDFVQPERRLVERLAFLDGAAAEAALARITAGETDFDALVAERGLDLSDVDLGDVGLADLAAAGEAVFAADPGAVVGPFDSPIGPALFRMNAILAAEETTFDEAAPDLRDELATARARRQIDEMTSPLNDLIAGGATLEDLAERSDLELGQIALAPDTTDGIAAYDGFRTAATAAEVGGFLKLETLDDGGVFALRIDAIREPALQELDDVRDAVFAGALAESNLNALRTEADRLAALIAPPEGFGATGLVPTIETGITRRNFIPGTPAEFLPTVFAMALDEVKVIPTPDGAIIAQVTDILPPDPEDTDTKAQSDQINEQIRQGIARDIFAIYAAQLRQRTDVSIDQSVLNAVHANLQ